MKLEKLTKEQEDLIPVVRQEWLDKLFNKDKRLILDKQKAKESIKWLYKLSGLKAPMTVFVSSPLAIQYGVSFVKQLMKEKSFDQVGDQVWAQVRAQVWAQVRAQVMAQVMAQVSYQVWDQVRAQVMAQVMAQVSYQVWDQVRDQVWAQVRAQVSAQVSDQVWAQVRDQVSAQVSDQVWDQYEKFAYYGEVSDYSWLSFYNYFARIGVITNEKLDKMIGLMDSGIFMMVQLEGLAVACETPNFIGRDNQNRLHCDDRSAISWSDGYEQFYLHGVSFDKGLWEKVVSRKMSFKEVMEIKNMEQRQVALKYVPPRDLIKSMKGELLDKSERGNELYKLPVTEGILTQEAYYLVYECPSTGRMYMSGIDPDYAKERPKADDCMAWKHNYTVEEYLNLKVEA